MKTKFLATACGIVLAALVFIAPLTASAQVTGPFSSNVNILSIGQDESIVEVFASNVTPGGFQNTRFVILNTDPEMKSQLAILLTALSTGKQVLISFTANNPAPNTNIITRVRITN